jgi:predicted acyl esterase
MPPTHTNKIQRLRYLTDPLSRDTLVAGPISLTLYASIDQEDTYWIVILKDVGPDVSVRTARAEEREIQTNIPERELTRGWLKASHRALDTARSKPWRPWHPLTRSASKPVVPSEITEYQIEIMSNGNMFKEGHRICLEITSLDLPTGTAGLTDVEYIPYHICSSKTTLHKIYHCEQYPSHLLLPIIPTNAQRWID